MFYPVVRYSIKSPGPDMTLKLLHVDYDTLIRRQKENFSFQEVSAVLADFGFVTMRLIDDPGGDDLHHATR